MSPTVIPIPETDMYPGRMWFMKDRHGTEHAVVVMANHYVSDHHWGRWIAEDVDDLAGLEFRIYVYAWNVDTHTWVFAHASGANRMMLLRTSTSNDGQRALFTVVGAAGNHRELFTWNWNMAFRIRADLALQPLFLPCDTDFVYQSRRYSDLASASMSPNGERIAIIYYQEHKSLTRYTMDDSLLVVLQQPPQRPKDDADADAFASCHWSKVTVSDVLDPAPWNASFVGGSKHMSSVHTTIVFSPCERYLLINMCTRSNSEYATHAVAVDTEPSRGNMTHTILDMNSLDGTSNQSFFRSIKWTSSGFWVGLSHGLVYLRYASDPTVVCKILASAGA